MSVRRSMLLMACALFALAANGCSTQARWVNCEGRLEPINQPAAHVQAKPSREPPTTDARKQARP